MGTDRQTDRRTDGQTQVTTITLRPKRPRVKKQTFAQNKNVVISQRHVQHTFLSWIMTVATGWDDISFLYIISITEIQLQFKTWCIYDRNVGKATVWVVPEICQHNVNINFCHLQTPEWNCSNKNTTRTNYLLTNMQVRSFRSNIYREKSVVLSLIPSKKMTPELWWCNNKKRFLSALMTGQ